MTHSKNLAILGKTGAGKTSLANALFGLDWKTDPAVATTRTVTAYEGAMSRAYSIGEMAWRLLDTPGVGESEASDALNFDQIYEVFHAADVILWVVQGDTRAFSEDQEKLLRLTNQGTRMPRAPVTIALNHVDQIHPVNWDVENNRPSREQSLLIPQKIQLIHQRFAG